MRRRSVAPSALVGGRPGVGLEAILLLFLLCPSLESFTPRSKFAPPRPSWKSAFAPSDAGPPGRHRQRSRTIPPAFMGKGDGKRRRKKKKTASTDQPSVAPAPAPLRVTNDINIPVRRQIRWAKMNQEYARSQTSFRQINVKKKTAYRKQLDHQEQQLLIEDRRRRNGEVDWDVILANGNGSSVGALVLVDGYNVIYQWPRLKKHMVKGNTERARGLLVRDLEDLHGLKGWRIECVFDGFGRKTSGPLGDGPGGERVDMEDRMFRRQDTGRGVRIVYSGVGASADSYIEKRCNDAKAVTQGKLSVSGGSLIVASNDAMISMVATGAGALCMSSDRLVDELKAVRKATGYRVEAAMAMVNGGHVRPEGLRDKGICMPAMQGARGMGSNLVGVSEVDGRKVVNTFRGGQFIIEDKRKKKEKKKKVNAESKKRAAFRDMVQGTRDTPSWAIVPDNSFTDRI